MYEIPYHFVCQENDLCEVFRPKWFSMCPNFWEDEIMREMKMREGRKGSFVISYI